MAFEAAPSVPAPLCVVTITSPHAETGVRTINLRALALAFAFNPQRPKDGRPSLVAPQFLALSFC